MCEHTGTHSVPMVSVIVPCRDEVQSIEGCMKSLLAVTYPKDRLEVLVVDGMSKDGTRDIVTAYAHKHAFIRLVDNPKRVTPNALNIGINNARGDIIMLLGAHAAFAPDSISKCVEAIGKSEADCVGGIIVTLPADARPMAEAIAIALSHPFGVGNAYFRIGALKPRWVDTVPFGCYKREVFDRIGMFDEELVRNQDDEFNLRLIKRGGRIRLLPEVVSYYYARDSLLKLWRMYYQYGYFKPLVAQKVGGIMTVRQVIPAACVLSALVMGPLALWSLTSRTLLMAAVLTYALFVVCCSFVAGLRRGLTCALSLSLVFPVLHVSYGLGYLIGMLQCLLVRRGQRRHDVVFPITR